MSAPWTESLIEELSTILADALVAEVEGEQQHVVDDRSTKSPWGLSSPGLAEPVPDCGAGTSRLAS